MLQSMGSKVGRDLATEQQQRTITNLNVGYEFTDGETRNLFKNSTSSLHGLWYYRH